MGFSLSFFQGQKFGVATTEGYGLRVLLTPRHNKYMIVISTKNCVIDKSGCYLRNTTKILGVLCE